MSFSQSIVPVHRGSPDNQRNFPSHGQDPLAYLCQSCQLNICLGYNLETTVKEGCLLAPGVPAIAFGWNLFLENWDHNFSDWTIRRRFNHFCFAQQYSTEAEADPTIPNSIISRRASFRFSWSPNCLFDILLGNSPTWTKTMCSEREPWTTLKT